jgi:uncharacterized integral membrane protein (TIGR00697 family)
MRTSSEFSIYQIVSAAFCVIVVIANIISAKMVALPGLEGISIPAGLLFYPLTFLLSDLVTEFYGPGLAKRMVYAALAMNVLSLGLIQVALLLPASSQEDTTAFKAVLGLSGLRIFASLVAYLTAQIVDIQLYDLIKSRTGFRFLWLRNNGSTCVSQIVDTVVVDVIYLFWGLGMVWDQVVAIMILSYVYKVSFSVVTTPLFYLCVAMWRKRFTNKGIVYEASL